MAVLAATLLIGLGAVGCTGSPAPPTASRPVPGKTHPAWAASGLPAAAAVSDVAACAGRWYAVGEVRTAGGAQEGPDAARRPAAWTSVDGQRWTTLPTAARSVYGKVSRLYAVACHSAAVAALGAAVGGVHGNPRTAAWTLSAGTLRELPAPFELFGGPSALSVDRITGGDAGWLVAGGWVIDGRGGAAAWRSTVGGFVPATTPGTLASANGEQTVAGDATALGSQWLVGGSTTVLTGPTAGLRQPLAWRSAPTGWIREPLPHDAAADAGLDRLVASGGVVYAAGTVLAGDSPAGRVVIWRRARGVWTEPVTIGSTHSSGSVVPAVRGLAAEGRNVVVTAGDGAAVHLWLSVDGGARWREVALPPGVPTRDDGAARLAVAVSGHQLLVAAGSGDQGRLWSARF